MTVLRKPAPKKVATATATATPAAAVPKGFSMLSGAFNTSYPKYASTPKGTVLINDGVYLGAVESRFGGYGYPFRMTDGSHIHLNGAGQLAMCMEKVLPGTHCHIVYCGTEVLEKGKFVGKECHQFQVSVGGAEVGAHNNAPASFAEDLDISL